MAWFSGAFSCILSHILALTRVNPLGPTVDDEASLSCDIACGEKKTHAQRISKTHIDNLYPVTMLIAFTLWECLHNNRRDASESIALLATGGNYLILVLVDPLVPIC